MALEGNVISADNINKITPTVWEANSEEIKQILANPEVWQSVPLINYVPLHNVIDHQFVRFRGMIQDMYDPEYFMERYEIRNIADGTTTIKSGRYQDIHPCGANEEFMEQSSNNVNAERQTLYCISVPGLNSWVKELEARNCGTIPTIATSSNVPSGEKRSADEDSAMVTDDASTMAGGEGSTTTGETAQGNKRPCAEQTTTTTTTDKKEVNLNFPLPYSEGKACMVKVYDAADDAYSLNDMVEAIGFLSVDPMLGNVASSDDDAMDEEDVAHNPPPSLVPRLHAVLVKKITHSNPLITPTLNHGDLMSSAKSVRDELHLVLSQLLLGDQLAADYLICHLISTVYLRRDVLALGQFSLNIFNVPVDKEYIQRLYNILSTFCTKSHLFAMTLDELNTAAFIPKKDYATNRLSSGLLQLSANTHLVLDETALQAGQLNTTGVHNMNALKSVVQQQSLHYDFQYYPLEFQTNIPVLVFSEGKSLLECDASIRLEPDSACVDTVREIFQAAGHFLQEPVLQRIRAYLTAVRHTEFNMPDDVQQVVQEDFVKLRKEDAKMTPSDLHSLLVLARLVSLSHGEPTLTRAAWNLALTMERQRKARSTKR